jgi:hypothetical protein
LTNLSCANAVIETKSNNKGIIKADLLREFMDK